MDPFFWERLFRDSLFTVSIGLDVFVGCLLIAMPRSRNAQLVGLIVATSYLIFLARGLAMGVWTCECFGGNSPIYYAVAFDFIALTTLTLARFRRSTSVTRQHIDPTFYFALVTTVIGMGVGVGQYVPGEALAFDVGVEALEGSNFSEKTDGRWHGNLTLRNNTQVHCSIVGLENSCQFRCSSVMPIELPPGGSSSFAVAVRLPKSKYRPSFSKGKANLFVQFDSPSTPQIVEKRISWGVFSF